MCELCKQLQHTPRCRPANVAYSFECKLCQIICIGKTTRSILAVVNANTYTLQTKTQKSSAISEHLLNSNPSAITNVSIFVFQQLVKYKIYIYNVLLDILKYMQYNMRNVLFIISLEF